MQNAAYRIEFFQTADAKEVTDLIKEVYGDKFPVGLIYDPVELLAAVKEEKFIPIVARGTDNRIAGFSAVYPLAPYRGVREIGLAVTRPQDRKQGISVLLYDFGLNVVAKKFGIEVMYGEAVCNHTFTQRGYAKLSLPVAETGLALDTMPAEAYEKEQSASGRVAVICVSSIISRKPHSVYIPAVYSRSLPFIYGNIDDKRTLLPSKDALPAGKSTKVSIQTVGQSGVGRLIVHEAGADFDQAFGKQEEELLKSGHTVLQAWLKLASPPVGDAVNRLRKKGYFLGGVLLRWFDEDGLLMQKITGRPNWEGIRLHSDRMKKVMEFVKQDWQETNR